jgi:hypothetical protein
MRTMQQEEEFIKIHYQYADRLCCWLLFFSRSFRITLLVVKKILYFGNLTKHQNDQDEKAKEEKSDFSNFGFSYQCFVTETITI